MGRAFTLASMASARSAGSLTTSNTLTPGRGLRSRPGPPGGKLEPPPRTKLEVNMKIGRDAGTGRFKPVKQAQADKKGSVVETIKRSPKK